MADNDNRLMDDSIGMGEGASMSATGAEQAAVQIADFVVDVLEYPGPATDLLGSNPVRLAEAIDSAALMELATFVEDQFRVRIHEEELVPENFATVADLVRLLGEKGVLTDASASEREDRGPDRP